MKQPNTNVKMWKYENVEIEQPNTFKIAKSFYMNEPA